MILRRLNCTFQAGMALLAVRQAGQSVEIRQADYPPLRTPFARKRNGRLPDLMGMKRLLQIRELLLRRHDAAYFRRIYIGVGRTDDDLERGIQLSDTRGRPDPILSRRHPHVEESD